MEIYLSQTNPQQLEENFTAPHWTYTPVLAFDDKVQSIGIYRGLVTLTGAVKLDFTGVTADWKDAKLILELLFPNISPPKKRFQIVTWAPFATISGIDKGGDNHDGGWAIDDFDLYEPELRDVFGSIKIWTTIRVRGSLFTIFRVGYSVTLSGLFIDVPPGP